VAMLATCTAALHAEIALLVGLRPSLDEARVVAMLAACTAALHAEIALLAGLRRRRSTKRAQSR